MVNCLIIKYLIKMGNKLVSFKIPKYTIRYIHMQIHNTKFLFRVMAMKARVPSYIIDEGRFFNINIITGIGY